jgi:hypothetical protein
MDLQAEMGTDLHDEIAGGVVQLRCREDQIAKAIEARRSQ